GELRPLTAPSRRKKGSHELDAAFCASPSRTHSSLPQAKGTFLLCIQGGHFYFALTGASVAEHAPRRLRRNAGSAPFPGAESIFSSPCGTFSGRLALGLSIADRTRRGAGLRIDRPRGAPFPGAESIFSSTCGAFSG